MRTGLIQLNGIRSSFVTGFLKSIVVEIKNYTYLCLCVYNMKLKIFITVGLGPKDIREVLSKFISVPSYFYSTQTIHCVLSTSLPSELYWRQAWFPWKPILAVRSSQYGHEQEALFPSSGYIASRDYCPFLLVSRIFISHLSDKCIVFQEYSVSRVVK
jgi:hypothetical protein